MNIANWLSNPPVGICLCKRGLSLLMWQSHVWRMCWCLTVYSLSLFISKCQAVVITTLCGMMLWDKQLHLSNIVYLCSATLPKRQSKHMPAFLRRTGEDHNDALVLCGWRLSSKTWNPITSPWMKQLMWLRIVHSGDWCLHLALCTPSGACQKWLNEWMSGKVGCQMPNYRPAWHGFVLS